MKMNIAFSEDDLHPKLGIIEDSLRKRLFKFPTSSKLIQNGFNRFVESEKIVITHLHKVNQNWPENSPFHFFYSYTLQYSKWSWTSRNHSPFTMPLMSTKPSQKHLYLIRKVHELKGFSETLNKLCIPMSTSI